jgi:hypothetical protein
MNNNKNIKKRERRGPTINSELDPPILETTWSGVVFNDYAENRRPTTSDERQR